MSLYINSIVGSCVDIPEEEDSYSLSEELQEFCKNGYILIAHKDEDDLGENCLIFGKKGKFGVQGMYGGWLMQLSDFIDPSAFPTQKEKETVAIAFKDFLDSLPNKYDWLKQLEWSEVNTYIRTST